MPSRYNSSSALDGLEDFPNTTSSTNTTSLKRGLSSSNLSNINTTTSTFTVQSNNNKNTNSEIPDELSITLCTWNVASQEPDRSYLYSYYRKLFINEKEKPDIIVIGFQEIEMNARALLAEQTDASDLWKSTLNECFSDYDCLAMHQLVGLCIVVYVHYRLSKYCSPCLISDKKEGALGKALGNKGAVSVRFRFADKWQFNLINVHLPANTAKLLERNLALNSIISSAVDDPSLIQNSTIVYNQNSNGSQFRIGKDDFVFVVGDFNYRIDSHFSFEEVISKIGQNRLAILYKCDQLQKEKQMGRILKGFSEAGPLNFIPTYKCKSYSPHEARHVDFTKIENIFTTKKERIPSWCDRIFYKDNPRVKPLDYRSYVNVATSDHKPVIAKLRVILSDTLIEEKTVQQETNLLSFEEVTPKKPLPPLPKHLIEAKKQKEHTNNILNFDDLLGTNETNNTIQIIASETIEEIGLHKTRSSSPLSGTRLISVLGNNDIEQKRKSREISSIKIETTTDNTQNLNTQSGFAALASRHSKTTNIDSNNNVILKSNNSSLIDSRLSTNNNNSRPVTMNQLNMDVLKRNTFDIGQLPDQTNNSLKVEDNNPYRKSTSIIESKSNNNNNNNINNNNDNNLDWWLF